MEAMRLAPLAAAAITLGLTAGAAAQFLGPGMPVPGAVPQQQQLPPCYQEFMPLRTEAQKRATVLGEAVKRKAPREEVCNLIKRFSEAEAVVVKFVEKNQQNCSVPADAVAQMKANHQRTLVSANQVCSAGPGPARQDGPGLSDALGVGRGPLTLDSTAPHSGAMDTLMGNVLAR